MYSLIIYDVRRTAGMMQKLCSNLRFLPALFIGALILFCNAARADVCKTANSSYTDKHYRCSCDPELCGVFGDCCYTNMSRKLQPPYSRLSAPSCVSREEISDYDFFLFDKCPKDYSRHDIRSLCEVEPYIRMASSIPAYTKQGLLFKNVYCGICNYIDKSQLLIPYQRNSRVYLTCDEEPDFHPKTDKEVVTLLNNKLLHCHISYVLPESVKRPCYQRVISKCPSNHPAKFNCEKSGRLWYFVCILDKTTAYANPSCMKCNLGNCTEFIREPKLDKFLLQAPRHSYDYSVILDLNIPEDQNYNATVNSTAFNETRSVINTIFLSLSIFSLLILVLIHLLVKELRNNLNGVLTIILSICLGLGMLIFSIAVLFEGMKKWCKAAAILIHFLYLCSFALMSLTAFDLVKTFLSKTITNYSMSKKKIVAYSVITFGVPSVIVACAVIVDIVRPDFPIAPAYGTAICWFNKTYGLLTWLYIPVALSVLFNIIVCLILVRVFIIAYKQSSQAINSKRQLVVICLKISVILGFAWGLMLIHSFINNEIFKFFASAINSLQGVFITITVLANRRIRKSLQSSVSTTFSSTESRRGSSFQRVKYTPAPRKSQQSSSSVRYSTRDF